MDTVSRFEEWWLPEAWNKLAHFTEGNICLLSYLVHRVAHSACAALYSMLFSGVVTRKGIPFPDFGLAPSILISFNTFEQRRSGGIFPTWGNKNIRSHRVHGGRRGVEVLGVYSDMDSCRSQLHYDPHLSLCWTCTASSRKSTYTSCPSDSCLCYISMYTWLHNLLLHDALGLS